MSEYKRNVAVGLTLAVALGGLAFIILLFGELPAFVGGGYPVELRFPAAGGIGEGADVLLNGTPIGSVTEVALMPDPREGVRVLAQIDDKVRIPANVEAYVSSRGLAGGAVVSLHVPPEAPPAEFVPTDGSTVIRGGIGNGLIPREVADAISELAEGFQKIGNLAETLDALLQPDPATGPGTQPATAPGEGLGETLARLNEALDAIAQLGNAENQENLRAMLENLRAATEQAAETMETFRQFAARGQQTLESIDTTFAEVGQTAAVSSERVQTVSDRLVVVTDQLGRLLEQANQVTARINQGEGTVGELMNNPRLYNSLVDTTAELDRTLAELQVLIREWREQGVRMRLR